MPDHTRHLNTAPKDGQWCLAPYRVDTFTTSSLHMSKGPFMQVRKYAKAEPTEPWRQRWSCSHSFETHSGGRLPPSAHPYPMPRTNPMTPAHGNSSARKACSTHRTQRSATLDSPPHAIATLTCQATQRRPSTQGAPL